MYLRPSILTFVHDTTNIKALVLCSYKMDACTTHTHTHTHTHFTSSCSCPPTSCSSRCFSASVIANTAPASLASWETKHKAVDHGADFIKQLLLHILETKTATYCFRKIGRMANICYAYLNVSFDEIRSTYLCLSL